MRQRQKEIKLTAVRLIFFDTYLLLADGKRRKTAAPKRKKAVHVACAGEFHHPALERIRAGEEAVDSEIRRALAAFRAESRRV